jgi:hypothetical protein
MDIRPDGALRIVLSGPLRLTKAKLGQWRPLEPRSIKHAAARLDSSGLFTVRSRSEDVSALNIFQLAGTSVSPYPLELAEALDLDPLTASAALRPLFAPFTTRSSPFSSAKFVGAVLRLFGNGYATAVFTVDLVPRRQLESGKYLEYLAHRFDYAGADSIALRSKAMLAGQALISPVCRALVEECGLPCSSVDGQLPFLSVFYVAAADWDPNTHEDLRLTPILRPMLQPEANDTFVNQSSSSKEFVIYTSGFHMYIWNRRVTKSPKERTIALVSFLGLMNIIYDQLNFARTEVLEILTHGRIPLFKHSDLDEKLEIIYSQVMTTSVSWRRDISSFRDQIDRRWRMAEMKNYCFTLIKELEARSARKRRKWITLFVILFSVAQLVSVLADAVTLTSLASRIGTNVQPRLPIP